MVFNIREEIARQETLIHKLTVVRDTTQDLYRCCHLNLNIQESYYLLAIIEEMNKLIRKYDDWVDPDDMG